MSFLTPDPDRFPRPAERFHWRWNRVFLSGQLGSLSLVLLLLMMAESGLQASRPVTHGIEVVLGAVGVVSILGGFGLPAASCLAGRLGAGRDGVTGLLVGGAIVVGVVMVGVGADDLLEPGSPALRLLAGALVGCGGAVILAAFVGGAAARGRWPGFGATVVGTLVVLANVFVPTSGHAPESDRVKAVKSGLRNLASAQELYLHGTGTYASDPGELNLSHSAGVILSLERTADGWIARGFHVEVDVECAVYIGSTPAPPAAQEEDVACLPEPQHFSDASRRRDRGVTMGGILGSFLLVLALALHVVRRDRDSGDPSPPPR